MNKKFLFLKRAGSRSSLFSYFDIFFIWRTVRKEIEEITIFNSKYKGLFCTNLKFNNSYLKFRVYRFNGEFQVLLTTKPINLF